MTTKIAIKPQSEYTADELRALDEWAAKFVGVYFEPRRGQLSGTHLAIVGGDLPKGMYGRIWHPTSTDAPLWQLGMVLEKIVNQPKLRKVFMDRLRGFKKSSCDFDGKQNLFFKHPATALAAIMRVENE